MPYNPGVTDISGQLQARGMAQGMDRLLEGFDSGLKTYQQNKHIADTGITKFGAAVAANNALKALLTDENQRATLPPDVVRAYLKLQKDGSLGARDATLLGGFADGFVKTSEEQQQQAFRTRQMEQVSHQIAMGKQAGDLAREQGVREKTAFDRGTVMNQQFIDMLALSKTEKPDTNFNAYAIPEDARKRLEDWERAEAFAGSSLGQLVGQGVRLTPDQGVSWGMAQDVLKAKATAREAELAQKHAKAVDDLKIAQDKMLNKPTPEMQNIIWAYESGRISQAEMTQATKDLIKKQGTVTGSLADGLTRSLTDPPPPAPGAGTGAPGAGTGAPGTGTGAGAGAGAGPKTYPVVTADRRQDVPHGTEFISDEGKGTKGRLFYRAPKEPEGDGQIHPGSEAEYYARRDRAANPAPNVRYDPLARWHGTGTTDTGPLDQLPARPGLPNPANVPVIRIR